MRRYRYQGCQYYCVIGPFRPPKRNSRSHQLIHFCQDQSLVIANTWTPQNNKTTWWYPRYNTGRLLDYFLVAKKHLGNIHRVPWKPSKNLGFIQKKSWFLVKQMMFIQQKSWFYSKKTCFLMIFVKKMFDQSIFRKWIGMGRPKWSINSGLDCIFLQIGLRKKT